MSTTKPYQRSNGTTRFFGDNIQDSLADTPNDNNDDEEEAGQRAVLSSVEFKGIVQSNGSEPHSPLLQVYVPTDLPPGNSNSSINTTPKFETTARRPFFTGLARPFAWAIGWFLSRLYYNVNVKPLTEHTRPNYICALSAFVFVGVPALWLAFQESKRESLAASTATLLHHPTGYIALDSLLTIVLTWRHYIYLSTLIMTCLIGLAERRGGLPGLPLLRRHFNIYLQLGRICTILSMISTSYILWYMPTTYAAQISAVWGLGLVCKLMSSSRQEYYYALYTFMWNNFSSMSILLIYVYNK